MTDLDLDAITADTSGLVYISDGTRGSDRVGRLVSAVPALVAEVRSLRAAAETSVPRARAVDLLASLIYQSDPSDIPVTMSHARRRAVYILDTRTREKNAE